MAQRQEERLAQRMTVWVAGKDARGNPFQQTARVVDISRFGARLGDIRCLRRPGERLEIKHRGKKAQFQVIWLDDFSGEAGVRLLEPGKDLWGVAFPPPRVVKYEPTKATTASTPEQQALRASGGWISGTGGQALYASFTSSYEVGRPTATPQAQKPEERFETSAALPVAKPERNERRYTRHRCNGGAEIRKEITLSGERVWGRITQLSLGGCYVAAMHPFAPQTKVALFLGVQNIEVRAKGVVCRSQPGVGMGIMFTELDEHNQRGLEILNTELAKGGKYSQFA